MRTVALLLIQLAVVGSSVAAPVTFKCTTAEGTSAADLVIDIEKRTMAWGITKYTIHAVDDRYISAYENSKGAVGGEVWVLNRISGEYLRASVFIGWDSLEAARKAAETKEAGKISAQTSSGKCARPLL